MAGTNKGFRIFANIIMILLMLCCLLPFILLITASITDEATLTLYGYSFSREKLISVPMSICSRLRARLPGPMG